MRGSDIVGYNNRFNDLATLCPRMVEPESVKIERYIHGLLDEIQGHVISAGPTTFESAKGVTQLLTNKAVLRGRLNKTPDPVRGGDRKRKFGGNKGGNSRHRNHNTNKKPNTGAVYAATPLPTTTPTTQKNHTGTFPQCTKCNRHHPGSCRD